MYLSFAIIFFILLILFFLGYGHRARIIRKIRCMPASEKCSLLNDIIRPFGYAYIPKWDIFTSRIDAWQREFGYCDFYDKSAVHLHMVLDCLPVYFDYKGETWLIEFWKGQYGINTGCEIGIYHAGRILDRNEWKSAHFHSVKDHQMLKISLVLSAGSRIIARLGARHWWLTAFCLGTFCPPSYLTLHALLNFPDSEMADAFAQGLMKAGVDSGDIKRHRNLISYRFLTSGHVQGLHARMVQWANRFWCRVYLSVTRPFVLSIDRVLYLYEFLPFAFRKMRISGSLSIKGKGGDFMSVHSRLDKSFEEAPRLPLNYRSKYVLVSDCHRGIGTTNDNFLKNQNLYFAALQYYYRLGYTYIELGDGDELWENKNMGQIISIHSDIFCLLSHFHSQGRLYMLHGNHDMVKRNSHFLQKNYSHYPRICGNNPHLEKSPLFPGLKIYSGIILENAVPDSRNLYLTHGHQADVCNSVFWRVSRFLVRHLWKPLEHFGVLDPTSAAKNYTRKQKTERRLYQYAQQENRILITGHTHRPSLSEDDLSYCNCGSCVHPSCITCLEIEHMRIRLVKWRLAVKPDMSLYAARELISGPAAVGK